MDDRDDGSESVSVKIVKWRVGGRPRLSLVTCFAGVCCCLTSSDSCSCAAKADLRGLKNDSTCPDMLHLHSFTHTHHVTYKKGGIFHTFEFVCGCVWPVLIYFVVVFGLYFHTTIRSGTVHGSA